MSVEYTKGDLLDFPNGCNVIAHSANSQRSFASGIAGQIRARYPVAYDIYMASDMLLGTFSVADIEGGKKIVNMITQERYGKDGARYVNYEALYHALETLRDCLDNARKEGRVYTLGLPAGLSSGLAGGSPTIIDSMILHLWAGSETKVVIVSYEKETVKTA
jgi:O-acetyl-ADP-ribose deacetylase (regulator of RNase III)